MKNLPQPRGTEVNCSTADLKHRAFLSRDKVTLLIREGKAFQQRPQSVQRITILIKHFETLVHTHTHFSIWTGQVTNGHSQSGNSQLELQLQVTETSLPPGCLPGIN